MIASMKLTDAKACLCPFMKDNCTGNNCMFWYMIEADRGHCLLVKKMM
jgi:hypothetical protein